MLPESRNPEPVDCARVREMLLDLDAGDRRALEEALQGHLDSCPSCAREARNVEALVRLARRALHTEVPPDVCRHLEQVLFGQEEDRG